MLQQMNLTKNDEIDDDFDDFEDDDFEDEEKFR